jgi:hypothetical protein
LSHKCNAQYHDHDLGELVLELVEVVDDQPLRKRQWMERELVETYCDEIENHCHEE